MNQIIHNLTFSFMDLIYNEISYIDIWRCKRKGKPKLWKSYYNLVLERSLIKLCWQQKLNYSLRWQLWPPTLWGTY